MKKTWIVVAHRAGARIFEHSGPRDLRLVEDIAHEEGRKKSSELESDAPGMAFSRQGQGQHAMSKEESAAERVAASFARDLADRLATGRKANRFEAVVLVAEPRFLGRLREALDTQTAHQVTASVGKDLAHASVHELPAYLQDVLLI
jgi:protein required for attachment to host cells